MGPLWSEGLEGISVRIVGPRCGIIVVSTSVSIDVDENVLVDLDSDVGPLWLQGLEATELLSV